MTIYLSKTIFAASQSILISRPTVAFYVAVVPSRCLGFIWLLCHFMPASPPLPAKEHYFLSHSLQFNFLIISKHLFHLWMCLPRTLLMICCDTFCLAFQRVFHLLRDLFWIQFTECSARVDATWGCEVKVCPGPGHPSSHTGHSPETISNLSIQILVYTIHRLDHCTHKWHHPCSHTGHSPETWDLYRYTVRRTGHSAMPLHLHTV